MKRATLSSAASALAVTISIHALVKRATDVGGRREATDSISIHALVKRATHNLYRASTVNRNFNPRPREEGDSLKTAVSARYEHFNPRPREEGDEI